MAKLALGTEVLVKFNTGDAYGIVGGYLEDERDTLVYVFTNEASAEGGLTGGVQAYASKLGNEVSDFSVLEKKCTCK